MQRKSRILNYRLHAQRNGFAMIMAIFFMIIIATLMLYMLGSTSETAQRTTNDYVLEQAQLLAKSSVEYAVLRVSGTDRSGPDGVLGTADDTCLPGFTARYPQPPAPAIFDIDVRITYFGFGDGCAAPLYGAGTIGTITTPESNGTMMIDVTVRTNPLGINLTEPISYHRRTLQKL